MFGDKIKELFANIGLLDFFWLVIVVLAFVYPMDTARWRSLRASACFALAASAFARHFALAVVDHLHAAIINVAHYPE
jgi:hypothetical protein